MTNALVGFLAGLSVGVYCLGLCLPVFLPLLLSQDRNTKGSFKLVLEFSLGRLIGYLFFGLIFGWFGVVVQSNFIHYVIALANIWTGILLILYSLGKFNLKLCAYIPFSKVKWPIILGFLTGVNVCPPFLASLTYVFNLKDVILSLIYFFMFFLGTSMYIVPAAFFGIFSKVNWVQKIAKISGIIVGFYFILNYLLKI